MKNRNFISALAIPAVILVLSQCISETQGQKSQSAVNQQFGGFESKEKWGEHLVMIAGCHDCHTPKKMTNKALDFDMSLALSGHPEKMPPPDVNRQEIEKKGLGVTQTLTAWVGPWGISYAANLTSDPTGIGAWKETQFFTAIRKGKFKGLETSRNLLPPMPWQTIRYMTDEELSAVFAYLKSTKPIKNVVPPAAPPTSAGAKN